MSGFVAALFFGAAIYLVGYSLWYVLTTKGNQHD
jgi:hypothetical protein